MRLRLLMLVLGGLLVLGCSLPGGGQPGAPVPSPDRTYSRTPPLAPAEPLSAEQALEVLMGYYGAGYTEAALAWTTGDEREYMQAVLAQWQAGTPRRVRQWTVEPESRLVIEESNAETAVAELSYINSASSREERIRFRFERSAAGWQVAGHTDPASRWWPYE